MLNFWLGDRSYCPRCKKYTKTKIVSFVADGLWGEYYTEICKKCEGDKMEKAQKQKKIFIIHPVRGVDSGKYYAYAEGLEAQGEIVYLPVRDTNQKGTSLEICNANKKAMREADEVHIFFNGDSQGSFFDLGMCFSMEKALVVVETIETTPHKSFQNFINEYIVYKQKRR